ncbi:hypothetical protein AA310_08640 [Arthrobacter sp. YC-RL1]|uniref:ComEA family DNA-binding protein n=1 Tax=Arthrobacter sp. YC-RL1 TaxID=1652545 RepID=UPI00063D9254|nr:ComEA family DNA-binding protein [Arthrobacter sp. YC-RL1]KLI87973.1 hypothetical protein AA310_08640 [Arthrobacter sp. YC-RL1]
MGRHDFFSRYAPRASRLRFAVSRVAVLVLVLVVLAWIGLSILLAPPPTTTQLETVPLVSDPSPPPASATPSTAAAGALPSGTAAPGNSEGAVTVHVVGAVKKPGVYTLPAGARIVDALEAAGGMRRTARPELLNLAARLADGQQIVLPGSADAQAAPPSAAGSSAPVHGTDGGAAGGKISLNSADAQQLQELPGIGPALAQRIIDFREAHGPFASVEELDAVSGIGPAVLGNLRELVQP